MKKHSKFRCVICNRVSDPEIETNAEEAFEWGSGEFYHDKKRDFTVCQNCQDSHDQLMSDYYVIDDTKFNKFKP